MKKQIINTTIADIVMQHASTATIFEKYGLDYCCHGKATLKNACSTQKINLEKIQKEIEKILEVKSSHCQEINFNEMDISELMEYIVAKHHAYLKQLLPLLYTHTQKTAQVHGEKHPEVLEIAYYFSEIKEDMEPHLRKEEFILFPYIQNLIQIKLYKRKHNIVLSSLINNPIKVMENEHEKIGSLLTNIRKLSNQYTPPSDACTTLKLCYTELKEFEQDTHRHIHLENNILFPKAIALEQEIKKNYPLPDSSFCEGD